MSRSSTRLTVEQFCCFGKLPISREFIVEGGNELSDSGFDQWVGNGVGLAKARLGNRFDQLISSFPCYRFLWSAGKERVFAGVICPSKDAAGRKHPFSLFACLRGKSESTLSTAIEVWRYQEAAAAMTESLSGVESPGALRDLLRSADQSPPSNETAPEEEYQSYLNERLGIDFWQSLTDHETSDQRFIVLQALVETLAPLRKGDPRAFRGGIRYPISNSGNVASAMESSFWIDLTERFLRRPRTSSWSLRSPEKTEDGRAFCFLWLTTPADSHWISLVDQQSELESISYLDRPYGTEPPEHRMDPNLRTVLQSDRASLSEYLRWARDF